MDLVPYAIPVFLLAIVFELVLDRVKHTGYYRSNDAINSLSLGVLSTASKLVMIDIAGRVYQWIREDIALLEWPLTGWVSYAIAFVIYDLCYYWFHRISHERKLFWAAHVVHHQSEEYNLTTALRQTSTGFLLNWLFYIPCFLLGMPPEVFVTVASANLIYQFWVHTRFIGTLGPLEAVFVTPMNHRVHHARNPQYMDRNYGGCFIIWDRLFGTYCPEDPERPADYGISRGLNSWNPVWANVHVYADMIRDSIRTPRLADKIRTWFGRTAYVPPGVDKGPLRHGNRYDPPVKSPLTLYVLVQFSAVVAVGLLMTYLADSMGNGLTLGLYAWLLFSLTTLGWLLERGPGRMEWLRLATFGLFGFIALPSGIQIAVGVFVMASLPIYLHLGRMETAFDS